MLDKMKLTVLLSISALSTAVYSYTSNIQLTQAHSAITKDFELPPNKPTEYGNFLPYPVNGHCKVKSTDPAGDELHVVVLKKGGRLENKILKPGDEVQITVHNDQIFELGANGGASLNIINHGEHTINAHCWG